MSEISTTNRVGRPLKFESVEDLQEKIDAYFKKCDERTVPYVTKQGDVIHIKRQEPYTISGLAYALDCSRETLLNYEDKEEFFGTIKKAKDKCLAWVETQLFEGTGAPAGVIFNLKNNYGWVDKTEQDVTSKGQSIKSDPVDKSDLDLVLATLKKASGEAADAATE